MFATWLKFYRSLILRVDKSTVINVWCLGTAQAKRHYTLTNSESATPHHAEHWGYLDDVIKWKHFPRYWPFVRGIHRSTVNSPHKGPVTRSFDVFLDLRLNKRLSKQSWGCWFETLSCPLWRHSNVFLVRWLLKPRSLISPLSIFYDAQLAVGFVGLVTPPLANHMPADALSSRVAKSSVVICINCLRQIIFCPTKQEFNLLWVYRLVTWHTN